MVSPALLTFMTRCFPRCQIIESYGSTECGGITFNNSLCSGIDYRLESVSEMGYTIDDKPFPRGELLVKSSDMFLGYANNSEERKAAVTNDGFFRTGDIIELQIEENKRPKIYVIDRKKSFFKLANGQYVSPEFLQVIYMQSPFIEQIYIHGDPMNNYVVAVVVPNKEYAQAFAINNNLTQFDMNNPDQQFVDAIINDMRSIATKESLGKHEITFRIIIDFEPFTAENGLLTSSLKLCRRKIASHYADRLKNHRTIEERLKDMLEITTGQQLSMNKSINFMAIGGNSLAAVRMSRMIQDELGVNMPLDVLFESEMTLEQIANFIKDPLQISFSSDAIVSKLNNDAEMELNMAIGQRRNIIDSPSTVFITDTTGFVGAFLLNELLATYPLSCKFICLVRCNKSSMNPFDRIYQNMSSLYLWKEEYRELKRNSD
jgi:fatty acid CoA ligase FadD9